jgi:hypothetical protein
MLPKMVQLHLVLKDRAIYHHFTKFELLMRLVGSQMVEFIAMNLRFTERFVVLNLPIGPLVGADIQLEIGSVMAKTINYLKSCTFLVD